MPKPKMDDIVLYVPSRENEEWAVCPEPAKAGVIGVDKNGLLHIAVLGRGQENFGVRNIKFVEDGEPVPKTGHYCMWPLDNVIPDWNIPPR